MSNSKLCTRCRKEKPLTEFRPKPRNKDGLNLWCRPCANKYLKTYNGKMDADGRCTNDAAFGRWIKTHRRTLGLELKQAEGLARLPEYRLHDIESGRGQGITRREVVALSVLYKLDKGLIEQKAIGA